MVPMPQRKTNSKKGRPLPKLADYSDEVTDEHLKRIKDLVDAEEIKKSEETCEAGW